MGAWHLWDCHTALGRYPWASPWKINKLPPVYYFRCLILPATCNPNRHFQQVCFKCGADNILWVIRMGGCQERLLRICYPSMILLSPAPYLFYLTISWTWHSLSTLSLVLTFPFCNAFSMDLPSRLVNFIIKLYNPHKQLTQLIKLCKHTVCLAVIVITDLLKSGFCSETSLKILSASPFYQKQLSS